MSPFQRLCAWLRRETHLVTLHRWDQDLRTPEQRTADLMARLQFARDEMKRRGTPTLLDGRPAWQRINPMGLEPAPKVVVRMRGRK